MNTVPRGKARKPSSSPTQPLRPIHADPDFHYFRVEYKVELATGNIHATYTCEDCPLKQVVVHRPLEGFQHHIVKENET